MKKGTKKIVKGAVIAYFALGALALVGVGVAGFVMYKSMFNNSGVGRLQYGGRRFPQSYPQLGAYMVKSSSNMGVYTTKSKY